MNKLLVGFGIGMPIGMLLADTFSERKWQKRARELMVSSREKVEIAGARIRQAMEEDLRKTPGRAGYAGQAALNGIERDELLAVYGIGPVLADRIIKGRPYRRDHEVVERGILSETAFAQLRRQALARYGRPA